MKTKLISLLALAVMLAGCAATPEAKLYQADLTAASVADAVKLAAQTGKIAPAQAPAARAVLVAINETLNKAHAAQKAGDSIGREFWLARFREVLAQIPPEVK